MPCLHHLEAGTWRARTGLAVGYRAGPRSRRGLHSVYRSVATTTGSGAVETEGKAREDNRRRCPAKERRRCSQAGARAVKEDTQAEGAMMLMGRRQGMRERSRYGP